MQIFEVLEKIHKEHGPTTGMKVSSGDTCKCGYWSGVERPGIDRPLGYQGLDWHIIQLQTMALSVRFEGVTEALELCDMIVEKYSSNVQTHYFGCFESHAGCLAFYVKDMLEGM